MTRNHPDVTLLAHNYVRPEVQDAADFVGDSLELARLATGTGTPFIVVAGVDFMAETAAVLNPDRTVLHPEPCASCAMALRLRPEAVLAARAEHPDAAVVAYVNTSAEVKAVSDICCTSANAVQVVNALEEDEVIFLPDRNLAAHVAARTTKTVFPVPALGCCPVHQILTPADLAAARRAYPGAEVMVHPECTPAVQDAADFTGSTSQMLRRARETPAGTVIVGTEIGMLHRLERDVPGKRFFPASPLLVCPDMKMMTLEVVERAIERRSPAVTVTAGVAGGARAALERMLALPGP
ncbi:MAG: quinolinate synthase NadA [Methanospirillum sp.]|nr:quinolinate synthase NadA [Methanospirillum sp.]